MPTDNNALLKSAKANLVEAGSDLLLLVRGLREASMEEEKVLCIEKIADQVSRAMRSLHETTGLWVRLPESYEDLRSA